MINLIAAVGKRGQLGLNGELPWRCPQDLQWFKQMTMGKHVIVGHNTALKLPNLPGRFVHVQQRDQTVEEYIEALRGEDIWIAGGAKTYERWMPYIDRFYLSVIDYDGPADMWMPKLPFEQGDYYG